VRPSMTRGLHPDLVEVARHEFMPQRPSANPGRLQSVEARSPYLEAHMIDGLTKYDKAEMLGWAALLTLALLNCLR
jgi:hypothetical protein